MADSDDIKGFEKLSPLARYDAAIGRILRRNARFVEWQDMIIAQTGSGF